MYQDEELQPRVKYYPSISTHGFQENTLLGPEIRIYDTPAPDVYILHKTLNSRYFYVLRV